MDGSLSDLPGNCELCPPCSRHHGFSALHQDRKLSLLNSKWESARSSSRSLVGVAGPGLAHRLTAAARMPMLVSFGGAEEWPGVMLTCSMRLIAPFSETETL